MVVAVCTALAVNNNFHSGVITQWMWITLKLETGVILVIKL